MANPQLVDYITKELARGVVRAEVERTAASGGWSQADITEAFSSLEKGVHSGTPPVASASGISVKYAGFWVRFVAVMVDGIILVIPAVIVQAVTAFSLMASKAPEILQTILPTVVYLIVYWAYFVIMTNIKGATLGKMLVGITVRSENGNKLSIGQIILRETVGKLVSSIIFDIGFIIAAFTSNKQSLHDKIAHTVVVYKDPKEGHRTGLIVGIVIACILPMIAILGILSSIVLVSLSSARGKATVSAIRYDLSHIRIEAEVAAIKTNDGSYSYSSAKSCDEGMFLDSQVQQIISDIKNRQPGSVIACEARIQTYAVSVAGPGTPLESKKYCVDSAGFLGAGAIADTGKAVSCVAAGE
jgi:uncharacterized RDD family membrane protein YckC